MSQTTENTVKSSFRHNFTRYLISDPECFDRHSCQRSQSLTAISAKNAPSRVPEKTFANPSANEQQITYPFSFPLCDMLICEFDTENTTFHDVTEVTTHLKPRTATSFPGFPVAVRGVVSVAEYIFQKVVRRKPVPFFHSETAPNYLGCYVVETLACGHEKTVYPTELETLTARKRNCHECSGWIGALPIGKRKAPASVKGIVRKRKDVGESPWWAIGFAIGCASLLIFVVATRWPKSYFYAYPTNYLRIVQKLNERDFMVQRVDHGLAQEQTMMRFCSDYLPWFEGGHILQWIRYNDHGSCQSMGPEDRGFDILRDANGMPVLPPNCRFDQVNNHIVCQGGKPKFD